MATSPGRRWVRHPGALWRDAVGHVLVLPPEGDESLALSGSGALLWELLADPVTAEEACRRLGQMYGAEASAIAGDVDEALAELARRGAVVSRP